jgi:hypothetical protein
MEPSRTLRRLGQLGDAGDRADDRAGLERHQDDLGVIGGGQPADRRDVFGGDEVIERLDVAGGDGLGDDAGRRRLGLGLALARGGVLRIENGRLPPTPQLVAA